MVQVRQTERFVRWLEGLRDLRGRAKVLAKPIWVGISELRINFGPGYRVYYLQKGTTLIILLSGGDKSSQSKDIQTALQLAETLSEESQ